MTTHVVPLTDLVEHTVPGGLEGYEDGSRSWLCIEAVDAADADTAGGESCVCGPTWECVRNLDGPDGWVVVHASLDGRELKEAA